MNQGRPQEISLMNQAVGKQIGSQNTVYTEYIFTIQTISIETIEYRTHNTEPTIGIH